MLRLRQREVIFGNTNNVTFYMYGKWPAYDVWFASGGGTGLL